MIERLVFVAKLARWLNTLTIKVSADKQKTWRQPPNGRVVVVAPHPDDEVIGCGGAILLHRKQDDPVDVVFLYDLTPIRRAEAEQAAQLLDVTPHFGKLTLKKLLSETDILYLPGLVDNNLDHLRVHHLIQPYAMRPTPAYRTGRPLAILLYEVWGPLLPNRLLTIDSVAKKKQQIIRSYRSQLTDRPYDEAALALNRYRGASLSSGQFAEAFLELSSDQYRQYCQRLQL